MPERLTEWALGFFAAAWLSLLSFIHFMQNKRIDNTVPRPEYEAMKKSINDELKEVKTGIGGIHARLDKIFLNRRGDGN